MQRKKKTRPRREVDDLSAEERMDLVHAFQQDLRSGALTLSGSSSNRLNIPLGEVDVRVSKRGMVELEVRVMGYNLRRLG
ncbi:MAG: hypothetical protein JNN11_01580 [Candidatus Doudnabacteria bacterium]|nr:hypothetical protein [Candidatus Doudnabacteria bacterium]